jgi:type II secretory pathway pseudopilin PulG
MPLEATEHPAARRAGVTIVELLVAMTIFVIVVGVMLSLLVTGLRAQRAAEAQSLRIQETEAVIHLINYEVGLPGYPRTENPANFTNATAPTISVTLGGSKVSDRILIRFFEDPDFLAPGDTGERIVEYRVSAANKTLERVSGGVTEVLVGSVASMKVVAFIGRDREIVEPETIAAVGLSALPNEIAGVRVEVVFADGETWGFLVGLYNRQRVQVTGSTT